MEAPRPAFRAVELRDDGPPDYLEAVAHAGQQPVELLVAQVGLARQELADAGLADPAEAGQVSLGGARLAHHLAEHVASSGHIRIIAVDAINLAENMAAGTRLRPHRIPAGPGSLRFPHKKPTDKRAYPALGGTATGMRTPSQVYAWSRCRRTPSPPTSPGLTN